MKGKRKRKKIRIEKREMIPGSRRGRKRRPGIIPITYPSISKMETCSVNWIQKGIKREWGFPIWKKCVGRTQKKKKQNATEMQVWRTVHRPYTCSHWCRIVWPILCGVKWWCTTIFQMQQPHIDALLKHSLYNVPSYNCTYCIGLQG